MAKKKSEAYRKGAASNLRRLADILNRHQVCTDLSPLRSAAEQCASYCPNGIHTWGYEISNLIFRFENTSNIRPKSAKDFRLEFSLNIEGDCLTDDNDQFTHLVIDLEKYAQSSDGEELKAAWHFDRDIGSATTHQAAHPLYHFQYGGKKLEEYNEKLGSTFLLDAPRLMHPPMDGILAIDFVLSNYAGEIWQQLRLDGEYVNLVTPAFEKIWKPYFEAIASSWASPKIKEYSLFCPHLS